MLWRGATDWPAFLTGRSMIIAGGMAAKVVVYPIGAGSDADHRLTNWAVMARIGRRGRRRRGARTGRGAGAWRRCCPTCARLRSARSTSPALIQADPGVLGVPGLRPRPDRRWSHGRVTLLGDAAHAMYPVGSNGASQAILDARALADALADGPSDVAEALRRYELARRGPTSEIVHSNRRGGPEGVIDAVEGLAPDGFDDVETVLSYADREAIVRGYAQKAGFAAPTPAANRQGGRHDLIDRTRRDRPPKRRSTASSGTSSARSIGPSSSPSGRLPGTRRSRLTPSCPRTSIPPRTSTCTCSTVS